jgi:hypothetical protein
MEKKYKYIKNAPLEIKDEVIFMNNDDPFSKIKAGESGIVTEIEEHKGRKIYYVEWISKNELGLVEGVDSWKKKVYVDSDESSDLNENTIFVTTKRSILKEIKRKIFKL